MPATMPMPKLPAMRLPTTALARTRTTRTRLHRTTTTTMEIVRLGSQLSHGGEVEDEDPVDHQRFTLVLLK
jgi:hypothetical protein